MKLLVESSKRFLCGEDLNRLETSFVKTSIKDSSFISFLFPKDCLNILILPLLPFIPDPIKLSKGKFCWMKMEWVKMDVIEGAPIHGLTGLWYWMRLGAPTNIRRWEEIPTQLILMDWLVFLHIYWGSQSSQLDGYDKNKGHDCKQKNRQIDK